LDASDEGVRNPLLAHSAIAGPEQTVPSAVAEFAAREAQPHSVDFAHDLDLIR